MHFNASFQSIIDRPTNTPKNSKINCWVTQIFRLNHLNSRIINELNFCAQIHVEVRKYPAQSSAPGMELSTGRNFTIEFWPYRLVVLVRFCFPGRYPRLSSLSPSGFNFLQKTLQEIPAKNAVFEYGFFSGNNK